MSAYSSEPITEGYVAQIGTDPTDGYRWHSGHFVYPNFGPFYNSAKAARREARANGKVFKVTVTYEEVEE